MVSKKVIHSIIETSVSKHYMMKCGKGAFNSKVLNTFNQFREETKDWNHEKVIFVTNKGETVWSKEGDKDSVQLDTYQGWLQSEHNGLLHIEHNHPQVNGLEYFPCILSVDDINKMQDSANSRYLYRSITAEYPNGTRMSVSKTKDFQFNHDFDKDDKVRELSKIYNGAISKYVHEYRDKILQYTGLSLDDFIKSVGEPESWGSIEYKQEVCKKVTNDMGSVQSYLESEGVVDAFLKEGLVLKLTGENNLFQVVIFFYE